MSKLSIVMSLGLSVGLYRMPSVSAMLTTIRCESLVAVEECLSMKYFCRSKHPRAHIRLLTAPFFHRLIHTQSTMLEPFGSRCAWVFLKMVYFTNCASSFLSASSTCFAYLAKSSVISSALSSSTRNGFLGDQVYVEVYFVDVGDFS